MTLRIAHADPLSAPVRALIAAHVAHGNTAYPAESNHHLSPEDYAASGTRLFTAQTEAKVIGMIGLRPLTPDTAELKSMHVLPEGRGRGTGALLVDHVITLARCEGIGTLFLETGSKEASAAARRLYLRYGFDYCPPFGDYVEDPESVFMKLSL